MCLDIRSNLQQKGNTFKMVLLHSTAEPDGSLLTLLSSSIQPPPGREESSSVDQGHLVSGNHIPSFRLSCLSLLTMFLPAPPSFDGVISPLRQQIQIPLSPCLHPRSLFSACDRIPPLHTPLTTAGSGRRGRKDG